MNTETINLAVPLSATTRRALERKAQRAGMSLEEYAVNILKACSNRIPFPVRKTA